jgi:hypothetical protein
MITAHLCRLLSWCCSQLGSVAALALLTMLVGGWIPVAAQAVSVSDEELLFYVSQNLAPLSGEQEMDYDSRSIYVVVDDVIVPRGKVMTFLPGCLIFVKKSCTIRVEGKLICKGTEQAPVTFLPLEPARYFAPPNSDTLEWGGIVVDAGAQLSMYYTTLRHCPLGVQAHADFDSISLDAVKFEHTRIAPIRVNERLIETPSDAFFSWDASPASLLAADSLQRVQVSSAHLPNIIAPHLRKPLRIGTAALTVAALVGVVGGYAVYIENDALYSSHRDPAVTTPQQVSDWERKRAAGFTITYAAAIAAALGALGLGFTILF